MKLPVSNQSPIKPAKMETSKQTRRPFHKKLMTGGIIWMNHKDEQRPNLKKTVFTYIYSFKRKTKNNWKMHFKLTQKCFLIFFNHLTILWLRLHNKEEIWAGCKKGFFYSGVWGQIPFAECALQVPEKTFLPLLQMWFILVSSISGYGVKVEKLGKKLRISRRLQIHKRFNEAKVERWITRTDIEC